MKSLLVVVFVFLVSVAPAASAVEAGDAAPAWQGPDLAGRDTVFPDAFLGQPTVVVFWATWCNYCRAFMPYLASIQEDFASSNVRVLAINAKENDGDEKEGREDPRIYMERHAYDFVTILNGDKIATDYGIEYIPGLFVVDGDGGVVYRRGWTELPAGQKVAEFWDAQVRDALITALR